MKPQVYKWLALVTMLISLVFVATNVVAKKPLRDDPCSELDETFESENIHWICHLTPGGTNGR